MIRVLFFLLCSALVGCGSAPDRSAADADGTIASTLDRGEYGEPLATLDWLAGSWVERSAEFESNEEHWVAARGGMMLGVNRTLRGPRAVAFEFLRIEARDEDAIVYIAQPGGRSPGVEFTMTEWSDTHVVFKNPEHDFPDTITYRRDGDHLSAHVEGTGRDGARGGFTLEWVRAGR